MTRRAQSCEGKGEKATRRASAVLDNAPVVLLAAIAGAGSFTHIRETAAEHGQRGPMSWAIAVCIDLTCVMAARERHRDERRRLAARRLSWPAMVLAGGILLSLAANLAQAQPTAWGLVMAATPSAAFLVAVSMLERRTGTAASARLVPVPAQSAVPDGQDAAADRPLEGRPEGTSLDGALVERARSAAADHQRTCGQPITRDALRARLGVSNQLASGLLRQIRTCETDADSPVALKR